jgi:16S rRNA (guanine527-N7)-methyltransferase
MPAMEHLIESAATLGILLEPEQIRQFSLYQALILEWNERINLTAVTEPQEIQRRHFVDSLTCTLLTGDLNGKLLVDVGSGAGFPGLPLKILFPWMKLTLVESVGKKSEFLERVTSELGLAEVSVVLARAEELGQDPAHREKYDWAVARAVAHLSPLMEYLLPLCRIGGHALAQKGAKASLELLEAQDAIEVLGGGDTSVTSVMLEGQGEANLVLVEKIRPTPANYPRRSGMPAKRPL